LDSAGRVAVFVLLIIAASASVLTGAVHKNALRLENRIGWKASPGWDFRGSFQARLRDQFSNVYFRKLDAGACYSLNGRVKLPVCLRFEDRVRTGGWFRSTYLLFDPTIVLAQPGNWRLDVRTRLQYLTNENSLHYIRIQPRLWRSFDWRGLGWWIYNDFYIRLADTGTGAVTNHYSNNFSTGFKLPLSSAADLNLYYMVFSMLAQEDSPRKHIHQACLSFGWRFGSNGHAPPAVRN
jgi:uncharacterized protein DUF2490